MITFFDAQPNPFDPRVTTNLRDIEAASDRANPPRQGRRTDLVYTNKTDINKVRPSGTSRASLTTTRKPTYVEA